MSHLVAAEADAGHAVALDQHHVGDVDGRLGGDDAAGGAGAAALVDDLGVPLDAVDALDDHPLLLAEHLDDLALGALVLAGDHLDGVALLDVHALLAHGSEHLRRERDDLHELLLAQLAAHGAEDAGAARLAVVLEDDGGVLVEADVGAVGTAALLDGAHDDGLDDVALLDVATGDRVLDGGDDDVADAGVAPTRATEHTDAQDLLGTGVVGDLESRLLLDHRFLLVVGWFSRLRGDEPGRTVVTSPSRGSRRRASAWWRTAGGSP